MRMAKSTNDYTEAEELLESLKGFQQRYGSSVLPSEDRINAEITYNKYDIFKSYLVGIYVGFFFFVFLIVQIFRDGKIIRALITFFKVATFTLLHYILLVLLHAGLSRVTPHGVMLMSR